MVIKFKKSIFFSTYCSDKLDDLSDLNLYHVASCISISLIPSYYVGWENMAYVIKLFDGIHLSKGFITKRPDCVL